MIPQRAPRPTTLPTTARWRVSRVSRAVTLAVTILPALAGVALVGGGVNAAGSAPLAPGPLPDGTAVTPEGWRITPAGRQTPVGAGPMALATTPDGELVLVEDAGYAGHALVVIDAHTGAIVSQLPGAADGTHGYYLGLAVSKDGRSAYASDGAGSGVHRFTISRRHVTEGREIALPDGTWPAGIALSDPVAARMYVAGNLTDSLLTVDLPSGAVIRNTAVGHLPYGVALSRDGARAYVSNWGGDTVSVVDLKRGGASATVRVGSHPSAICESPERDEIYVANTDSDSVSVLDSRSSKVIRTIDLRPSAGSPTGASPNALALSRDGRTLYVADAGRNDVTVIRLGATDDPTSIDRIAGAIPTGWYPSGVALDLSGDNLLVINMKGTGVGPVAVGEYIADLLRGSLSRIPLPDAAELATYSRQVRDNMTLGQESDRRAVSGGGGAGGPDGQVIPARPGEPSVIKHVIYVMKENRTYDQVLGDLEPGNGDPSLAIFGRSVTPNQHALARQFVTLDNFFCDGEVSADGWSWSSSANANTYNQKNWPLDYGTAGRLYDFGGFGDSETAGFPGDDVTKAFLWDRLHDKGVSYRNYGFFVNANPVVVDASMKHLQGKTDLAYPGWDLDDDPQDLVLDQGRVDQWLKEFRRFEAQGAMPTMQFIYLPRDHTDGTSPGYPTPAAMVADNDLALGRLVEEVSRSRFWRDTAIFVVEDDAQDGPDHVDGHRTVALVISPFTETGRVDSTFYSTVSMLKTMELIVGVGPMTQFDALASPMMSAFVATPNFGTYRALTPEQPLDEINPPDAPLAELSARLDFSRPDSADPRILNEAIWKSVKGPRSRLPAARLALYRKSLPPPPANPKHARRSTRKD